MGKNMETIIMGYTGTDIRIHSFIPSYSPPEVDRIWLWVY